MNHKRSLWISALVIVSLLSAMIAMPTANAVIDYYDPNAEDIEAGTKESGTFPDGIDDRYQLAIRYREASLDLKVKYEWDDVPPTRLILDMRSKVASDASCSDEYVDVQAYNSSSSDWDTLFSVTESDYADDSVELTWYQLNNSKPTIRFLGQDPLLCLHDSLNFTIDYISLYDYYTKKITDLEDELRERIDELERELQRLRKELRDTLPPVYVNETGLPTIPRDSRGRGSTDDNMVWLDPFRTTVYSVAHFDSGSDLDFHLPYPTSAEEVSILSDDLWIAEKSYSTLFVNDTDGNEILNTTDPVTYYGGLEGQNITIQTSGASSSVRADRVTVVRLIDSFSWGESLSSGYFAVTSKTENEISYNQECIRVYWAFPESDSEGRAIQIDGSSIRVQDMDSSLYLDRGRHFEATEIGGVSLELRWLNTSTSRTFRIEFTRASHVETTEYYVIHDTEISISDTYPGSSYTANVHISQSGTANFEGMIVVKFLLTGMYADRQLDPHTLIIKRSDQSGSTEFWYDSVSRELRLTDISIDAGDSITFSLFWDWAGPTTPIVSLLVAEPLIVYSLILLTGFLGLLAFTDEKNVKSWKRWAGLAGIIAAIIAVLLLASGVGSVAAMLIVPGWGG